MDTTEKELDCVCQSDDERGNRLCISLSDIHLTDGTVGKQDLPIYIWEQFCTRLEGQCKNDDYSVDEVVIVLDGDIVDMIRSGCWTKWDVYPWQRSHSDFDKIVNEIIRDIVEVHKDFFEKLRTLPKRLIDNEALDVKTVKIIPILGNHDKELMLVPSALAYFYTEALGWEPSEEECHQIGKMYGDENQFSFPEKPPYFPFYFADSGFRFFTTHGQWRDKSNSRPITAKNGLPEWSIKNGWQIDDWKALKFSPFLEPCFGDVVAAGVLSRFIYNVKKNLKTAEKNDPKLDNILDELDLYRPAYLALQRIIEETKKMSKIKENQETIKIIEDTLYQSIMTGLEWDFTYQSSNLLRSIGLRSVKNFLKINKFLGLGFEIKSMPLLIKIVYGGNKLIKVIFNKNLNFKDISKFPAFLDEYKHYGFQIHGEGHTHHGLQEEINLQRKNPSTYINFGTWRDQIVPRKGGGYRRRGILRALYILDLNIPELGYRTFDYFVDDVIHWSDLKK